MPSITTWNRLEPRTTSTTLSSVQARLADPLWLLARQWQLGELRASDGGSAAHAVARVEHNRLERYRPGPLGPGPSTGIPLPDAPLEAVVEAETGPGSATDGTLFAARAGQCFLRMLGPARQATYAEAYTDRFRLGPPLAAASVGAASRRLLDLLVGRVPDGFLLYAELDPALRPPGGGGALPPQPQVATADHDAVRSAALAWLDWFDQELPKPVAGAWQPQRLEYAFAVSGARPAGAGGGEVILVADGHRGGDLDWYSFDAAPSGSLGGTQAPEPPIDREAIPTPVRFPGMPNARWWEFEDATTNLGAIDAAPDDLGRMLLLEFALVYGNDFLYLPVDLEIGSLSWISQLTVTTTFGDTVDIPSVEAFDGDTGPWSMFRLSADGGRAGFLFLPPTSGQSLHGPDLERVVLLRDEMANAAWAVEDRVQDAIGNVIVPREVLAEQTAAPAPPPAQTDLTYRLATPVPEHWHALLPTIVQRQLAGVAFDNVVLETSGLSAPQGLLLRSQAGPYRLTDEELAREGLVVTRVWQRSRWIDGSTHAWVGRRRRTGRGEGYSGLRFDTLDSG